MDKRTFKKNLKRFIDQHPLVIIGPLAILFVIGVAVIVVWSSDNSAVAREEKLFIDIFEHDYIRIDGISYPTKDISRLQFSYDVQYGYMELNDQQVIVRFNTGEFVLYDEGCFPYGDTTQ